MWDRVLSVNRLAPWIAGAISSILMLYASAALPRITWLPASGDSRPLLAPVQPSLAQRCARATADRRTMKHAARAQAAATGPCGNTDGLSRSLRGLRWLLYAFLGIEIAAFVGLAVGIYLIDARMDAPIP